VTFKTALYVWLPLNDLVLNCLTAKRRKKKKEEEEKALTIKSL
jgi:hypothetical protein